MTRWISRIWILCILLLAGAGAYAQSRPADLSASEQLAALLGQYAQLSAQFEQGLYDGNGTLIQRTQGTMAIQRPDHFRWVTQTPNQQIMIASQQQLYIFDVDLAQITLSQLSKEVGSTPAMLMTASASELDAHYKVNSLPPKNQMIIYALWPKSKHADFQSIRVFFQKKLIKRIEIVDNMGQLTAISFSHLNTQPALSPSLFKFKYPKGVDVIHA